MCLDVNRCSQKRVILHAQTC